MKNKSNVFKRKIKICLNVLLHYSKYCKLAGEKVKILDLNIVGQYSKLIGESGYVYDFEFENFEKPIIVHFPKIKKEYCFAINELEVKQ